MVQSSLAPVAPDHLRELLGRSGFDMAHLAREAGVSRQFISLLLLGKRRCSPAVATAIATAVQRKVEDLFTPEVSDYSHNKEESAVTVTQIEDPYLNFDEVAELAHMPIGTLRHYRVTKKGPEFFPVGGRLKIRRSKALAWIEAFEKGTAPQSDAP